MRIAKSVRRLEAYTPGEQPKTRRVVKLNTNENPYPPCPRVAEALAGFDAASLRLYPPPGADALRRAIAERHGVPAECVFAGNGSDEVLRLAVRAFTETGGCAAMFDPTYSLYPVLCAAEEVRAAAVPLEDDFSWREPEPPADATLFFLTNPNAPTGVRYPDEAVEAFARRFPGVVLMDEAYGDFAEPEVPGVRLAMALENVLVCRTFSKSYGLAGIRCGYAIGAPRLIGALDKLKDSYNLDAVTQRLACAAMGDSAYMRETARRIVATRERTAGELRRRGWTVVPSQSNFLFARPPAGTAAADVFAKLRAANVFVRYFGASPKTRDWLRISIGTDAQMEMLFARL